MVSFQDIPAKPPLQVFLCNFQWCGDWASRQISQGWHKDIKGETNHSGKLCFIKNLSRWKAGAKTTATAPNQFTLRSLRRRERTRACSSVPCSGASQGSPPLQYSSLELKIFPLLQGWRSLELLHNLSKYSRVSFKLPGPVPKPLHGSFLPSWDFQDLQEDDPEKCTDV